MNDSTSNLTTPTGLASSYTSSILTVSWQAADGATAYAFELWDTGSTPTRVSQQAISVPTTQAIVQMNIGANQIYTARVSAQAGGVSSAWAELLVVTNALPPILQQVQIRLQQNYNANAQQQLMLNQTTIGNDQSQIIQLFSSTLGVMHITVNTPSSQRTSGISTTDRSVTVVGTVAATLLGVANMGIQAIFEAPNNTLRLTLKMTSPSGWHFSQTFSFLAASYLDTLALTNPAFLFSSDPHHDDQLNVDLQTGLNFYAGLTFSDRLALVLMLASQVTQPLPIAGPITQTSQGTSIHLEGRFPDVSLTLGGIAPIAMAHPRFCIDSLYVADQLFSEEITSLQADVVLEGVSVSLPLSLQFPINLKSWQLTLLPGQTIPVTGLSAFLGSISRNNLLSQVPSAVSSLPGFSIYDFRIQFDLTTSTFSTFSLGIESLAVDPQTKRPLALWTIQPGLLELSQLRLELGITRLIGSSGQIDTTDMDINATLSGAFRIGSSIDLIGTIVLPIGSSNWTLTAITALSGVNLANFNQLLGNRDIKTVLPPRLGDVTDMNLASVAIAYDPSAQTIAALYLELHSSADWVIVPGRVVISAPQVSLHISQPLTQRTVTGVISGTLSIGSIAISMTVERPDETFDWDLGVSTSPVVLPSLADMTTFLGGQQVVNFLPDSIANGHFILNSLDVSVNLNTLTVNSIDFQIISNDTWTLIADYLSVNTIDVNVALDWAPDLTTNYYVEGVITLADVGFEILATRSANTWTIAAALDDTLTVDLTTLNSELLPTGFSPPYEYGFPRGVQVNQANLVVLLPDQSTQFTAQSTFDWTFSFAQAGSLSIVGLAISLTTQKLLSDGTRPYTFSAAGQFAFNDISALVTFIKSNTSSDTILTAQLNNAQTLNLPGLTHALTTGQQNQQKTWIDVAPQVPTTLSPFGMFNAGLALNLTRNIFMLYGSAVAAGNPSVYTGAVFLAAKQPNNTWGYFVAVGLAEGFHFASVVPELTIIDSTLTVTRASFSLSSFSTSSLQALINSFSDQTVEGFPSPRTKVTDIIKLGTNADIASVRQGVNFYAQLQFTQGLLLDVAQLLGITTSTSFTVAGYISSVTNQSEFQARLGDLRLLNALSFNGIRLAYTVGQQTTFTLNGTVVVHIDQDYSFTGDVKVIQSGESTHAQASIATTHTIIQPLGLPSLTIDALYFALDYVFMGPHADTQYMLGGSVSFSNDVSLAGFIYFKNNAPVVAGVKLSNLSIDTFFAKIFQSAWPTGLLDINLKNGTLYYAPNAANIAVSDATTNQITSFDFQQGFHATAAIDVYFIKDFPLQVDVVSSGPDAGITATGALEVPIDWRFITLYRGPTLQHANGDPEKGPEVSIHSKQGAFTLSGGFAIFNEHILSTQINVTRSGMTGKLSLDRTVEPFGQPTLDFEWDNEGFRVKNWPLGQIKLPDFNFENIQVDSECPASGILKVPITSKVDLIPSLTITTDPHALTATPSLKITLNGTFNLVVNSSAYPDALLSANIVNAELLVPFPIGAQFTWGTLAGKMVDCIKSAATSIFNNLIKDPANLSKLLAINGIEWGAQAVTDFLVCEAIKQGIGAEEALAEATAFVEGATGAAPVVLSILGVTGIVVGGTLMSKDANNTWHNSSRTYSPEQPPPPRPGKPTTPRLDFQKGSLGVSWDPVANAQQYIVELKQDNRPFAQRLHGSLVPETFYEGFPSLPPGHTYGVQVVAVGSGGISDPSDSVQITLLKSPTSVSLTYTNENITVGWPQVAYVPGYEVQLLDANHNPIGLPTSVPSGQEQVRFPISVTGLVAGAVYARVRSTSTDAHTIPGEWTVSTEFLTRLERVHLTDLTYAHGKVTADWFAPVASAQSYALQLLDATTGLVVQTVSVAATTGGKQTLKAELLTPPELSDGIVYVLARALSSEPRIIPSEWAVSPQLPKLPLPTGLQLTYTSRQLQATWNRIILRPIRPDSSGLTFDGLYQTVYFSPTRPDDPLTTLRSATWEVWFWPEEQNVRQPGGQKKVLFRHVPAGLQTSWQQEGEGGVIAVGINPTTLPEEAAGTDYNWTMVSVSGLPSRQWYHVAGVVDAHTGSLALYINGVLRASTACPPLTDGNRVWTIGGPTLPGAGLNFKGRITEVRIWNIARDPLALNATMHRRLAGNEPGLVGYWPFTEGTSRNAPDHSPFGHTASLGDGESPVTIPEWTPSNSMPEWIKVTYDFEVYGSLLQPDSSGLSFDGIYQIMYIPASEPLNKLNSVTWEAWFWPEEQNVRQPGGQKKVLFRHVPAGLQTSWQQEGEGGTIAVGINPTTLPEEAAGTDYNWTMVSVSGLPSRQWYHVAGVVDAHTGSLALYINGVLRASTACPPLVEGSRVWSLGSTTRTGEGYNFKGLITEVRIWNTARDQQAIKKSMHTRLTGQEDGLVGYWPLTEVSGTVAGDHSKYKNTASLGDGESPLAIPTWAPNTSSTFLSEQFQGLDTANSSISNVVPGETYYVQVRPQVPGSIGEWSTSDSIEIPPPSS